MPTELIDISKCMECHTTLKEYYDTRIAELKEYHN